MQFITKFMWKVLRAGGWAPLLVFAIHLVLNYGLNAYHRWPSIDIPMHFSGGLTIAFFISGCFQELPRLETADSRVAILELILIGSLTATTAVFWEFAEFSLDRLAGTNLQVNLANTIMDMAMGILGAVVFMSLRIIQLRTGSSDLKNLVLDWTRDLTT